MRVMGARGGQRGQDPLGQARNVGSDPHRQPDLQATLAALSQTTAALTRGGF